MSSNDNVCFLFQEFQYQYVFGCEAVKSSLLLMAEHHSKVRQEAEAVRTAQDTVTATSYFSKAAQLQTQRLREEKERNVEKDKDRIFAEQLERASKGRTDVLNKQRCCHFLTHIADISSACFHTCFRIGLTPI